MITGATTAGLPGLWQGTEVRPTCTWRQITYFQVGYNWWLWDWDVTEGLFVKPMIHTFLTCHHGKIKLRNCRVSPAPCWCLEMRCEQDEVWKMLKTVSCSLNDPHRESPGGVWAVHDRCPRGQVSGLSPVTGDCSHGGTRSDLDYSTPPLPPPNAHPPPPARGKHALISLQEHLY